MIIEKTKSAWPVTLAEVKDHLNIDADFTADDSKLTSMIRAATEWAEGYIDKDIALTTCTAQFSKDYTTMRIKEGNLRSVTSVTDTEDNVLIASSRYTVTKNYNSFDIEFDEGDDDQLFTVEEPLVVFVTGYTQEDCPYDIKQAIMIRVGDLYDIERNNYAQGAIKNVAASERLLNKYVKLEF
jgi:uncharacterized phiE125 gp8 family phage protein